MTTRIARAVIGAVLLALSLSSCELTVRLTTRVEQSGGGVFSIALQMDEELRETLERHPGGTGSLDELFEGLRQRNWEVRRAPADDGLIFEARRRFRDRRDFARAIEELKTARGDDQSAAGGVRLEIGYDVDRSFLRTETRFRGAMDTSSGARVDEATRQALAELVRFEVRAEMPGVVQVTGGDGSVREDGSVVWHPQLGQAVEFAATSRTLRIGSVLVVLLPILLVLGLVGWLLVVRRARRRARTGTEEPLAIRPEQNEQAVSTEIDAREPMPAEHDSAEPDSAATEAAEPERL